MRLHILVQGDTTASTRDVVGIILPSMVCLTTRRVMQRSRHLLVQVLQAHQALRIHRSLSLARIVKRDVSRLQHCANTSTSGTRHGMPKENHNAMGGRNPSHNFINIMCLTLWLQCYHRSFSVVKHKYFLRSSLSLVPWVFFHSFFLKPKKKTVDSLKLCQFSLLLLSVCSVKVCSVKVYYFVRFVFAFIFFPSRKSKVFNDGTYIMLNVLLCRVCDRFRGLLLSSKFNCQIS